MGHHSVLEHVAITFAIDKISRACSHQLVRHRIASYSQQSQRYVKYDKVDYVIPPSMDAVTAEFDNFMEDIMHHYKVLIEEGVPPEDARYIFPNAVATNITMTVNVRELVEMCKLRLCTTAQWEIKKMFEMIVACVRNNKELTFLSEYLSPKCDWLKHCPEGKRSCGKYQIKNGD